MNNTTSNLNISDMAAMLDIVQLCQVLKDGMGKDVSLMLNLRLEPGKPPMMSGAVFYETYLDDELNPSYREMARANSMQVLRSEVGKLLEKVQTEKSYEIYENYAGEGTNVAIVEDGAA